MLAFAWDFVWIPLACVIGAMSLVLALGAALAFSARKGGLGQRLLNAISRGVMAFKPTRRLALRFMDKARMLPPGGFSTKETEQANELLGQMSKKNRDRLVEMSLGMEKAPPEERDKLVREASELVANDLSLSREQRRRAQRAQSHTANRSVKPKRKKKRR
jgi:hypothetical protein